MLVTPRRTQKERSRWLIHSSFGMSQNVRGRPQIADGPSSKSRTSSELVGVLDVQSSQLLGVSLRRFGIKIAQILSVLGLSVGLSLFLELSLLSFPELPAISRFCFVEPLSQVPAIQGLHRRRGLVLSSFGEGWARLKSGLLKQAPAMRHELCQHSGCPNLAGPSMKQVSNHITSWCSFST